MNFLKYGEDRLTRLEKLIGKLSTRCDKANKTYAESYDSK